MSVLLLAALAGCGVLILLVSLVRMSRAVSVARDGLRRGAEACGEHVLTIARQRESLKHFEESPLFKLAEPVLKDLPALATFEGRTIQKTEHYVATGGEHVFILTFTNGSFIKVLDPNGAGFMVSQSMVPEVHG